MYNVNDEKFQGIGMWVIWSSWTFPKIIPKTINSFPSLTTSLLS